MCAVGFLIAAMCNRLTRTAIKNRLIDLGKSDCESDCESDCDCKSECKMYCERDPADDPVDSSQAFRPINELLIP